MHGGHQLLSNIRSVTLGSLTLKEPEYGSGSRAIPTNSPSDIKYIRITDFSDDGIPPNHEFVTAETVEDKYTLEHEDILFARSGATAGKTFIYTADIGEAIFAGYCIRFQFDYMKVIPKFVYFYTKTQRYQLWVNSIQRPSGQPNINKEEFKSFTIPLPSLETQSSLVAEIEAARQTRKQKLAQADELLSSLNTYLLNQLGLSAPEKSDQKVFAVRKKQITSSRLDSFFYTPSLIKTEQLARRFKPKVVSLVSLLREPPLNGVDARDYEETGQRYLRVQNIRPFDLVQDDVKYVSVAPSKDVLLKAGDVLLTRKGTFGVAAVVSEDAEDCLISSEIILLRMLPNAECSADYLTAWLNSSLATAVLNRHKTGGIMGHITQDVVSEFPVPIPAQDIQQKIVSEIHQKREEAHLIRRQAETEWKVAKTRFEHKLLGEEA